MNKAIENYYKELDKLKRYGAKNELNLKRAFAKLLNEYAEPKGLFLLEEMPYKNKRITPDGTIKDALGLDHGYWEAKDTSDDLSVEIAKKLEKGYPDDNILFENTDTATLIQNRITVFDNVNLQDSKLLEKLLNTFFGYERPEIADFRHALEKFKDDLPKILVSLREKIQKAFEDKNFLEKYEVFLLLCQNSIDPKIDKEHIIEMLLQHILTEDIFKKIFDDDIFHSENDIAHSIGELVDTFLDKHQKRTLLSSIAHYYDTIRAQAVNISDWQEKRKFLNLIYENFYKAYNPKAADKLGIVYTPSEIVQWMIEATDEICYKHFGKTLSSEGITILDPCIGTGTFLCQVLDFLAPNDLKRKFDTELFATEISLLPYYIANLNIEYTYKQRTQEYKEFPNLSFADTLELHSNIKKAEQKLTFFTEKNAEKIETQEKANIHIIIGNPPYNANQQNENDNNKNRSYPEIDKRIKETYIKASNAQKTKMYDMYSRFYRWASDRIDKSGIVTFVTNSSFIHSKTFDGFRATVFKEFQEIYVLDLGGDVRKNPKISGTKNNVFGIQTGVAIAILVKNPELKNSKIYLLDPFAPLETRFNKLTWLSQNPFKTLQFEVIAPDKKNNWINQTQNDWESLLPLGSKEGKAGKSQEVIFRIFSPGVVTARDEWVYDFDLKNLESKTKWFISEYNRQLKAYEGDVKKIENTISWSEHLKNKFSAKKSIKFQKEKITKSLYRPFTVKSLYFDENLNDRRGLNHKIFNSENIGLNVLSGNRLDFCLIAGRYVANFSLYSADPCATFPFYFYEDDKQHENITDWALRYFQEYYKDKTISKPDIFHYCYGVLHEPKYRQEYEINLKQDLPRIPLREDFKKYAEVGKELLNLHIDFENVEPFSLARVDVTTKKTATFFEENEPKVFCRISKDKKSIEIDEVTTLEGLPIEALEYRLGIRSAVEWILDQYKPKKSKDPTIAEKFDNYKFSEHKDYVVELLKKIVTLSLKTNDLIKILDD